MIIEVLIKLIMNRNGTWSILEYDRKRRNMWNDEIRLLAI